MSIPSTFPDLSRGFEVVESMEQITTDMQRECCVHSKSHNRSMGHLHHVTDTTRERTPAL